jgi:2-polyprenyl-3-methyl-5-hydroxy-6-metoxy-1,4-benzoquinol methylase
MRTPDDVRRTLRDQIITYFDNVSIGRDAAIAAEPNVAFEQGARHAVVRRAAKHRSPLKVMDLGCGNGRDLVPLMFLLPEARLTSVDISQGMLENAAAALRESKQADRVTMLAPDLTEEPDSVSGTFDFICRSEVLEHVPRWKRLVEVMGSKLAAGGGLLVTVPNRRSLYGLDRLKRGRRNVSRGRVAWHHPYDSWRKPREIGAALDRAGLRVEWRAGACYLPRFTVFVILPAGLQRIVIRVARLLEPLLSRLMPRQGYMYCVFASKAVHP